MRLVCPNCGAQYEVPDEVIPENGRDVQCSNCGDTWFQNHPDHDEALAEELGEALAPELPAAEDEAEPEGEAEPEAQADEAPPEPTQPTEPPEPTTPPVTSPRRRELDPSVTDVLREEAAREQEARQHEASPLEEQPDLGLSEPDDEAARRQRQARERMARMRGEDPEEATAAKAAAAASTGKRRDVLPDIDEINSTLRKDSERRKTATEAAQQLEAQQKSGGFRRGFLLVLLLAVLFLLVYVFAPQIAEAVPALAGPLESYVSAVNDARQWLDGQMRGLMGTLDGMASEGDTPQPATEPSPEAAPEPEPEPTVSE